MQKKDDELEKLKKSQEISDRRLEQKMEEIARMKKQGSMELQGEIQEERLQDYLEKILSKFPRNKFLVSCLDFRDQFKLSVLARKFQNLKM